MPKAMIIAVALGLCVPVSATAQIECIPQQVGVGEGFNYMQPRLSRNGNRVVFAAASNLTGQNADHSWEVFLYDVPSGTLTQVTDSPVWNAGNDLPSISGDGTRIVYRRSVAAPPYAYFDIWLYDTIAATHTLVSLPANPAFAVSAQISADGTKVAIEQSNVGIRLYDVTTATNTAVPIAGTNPSISGDGRYIAVETFTGQARFIDRTTNVVTQIPGVSTINTRPVISADGTTIVFISAQNLAGQNGDGSTEVHAYDIATGTFRQLSHAPSGYSQGASVSENGSVAVWEGNHDADGSNAGGHYNVFAHQAGPGLVTNLSKAAGPLTWQVGVSGDGSQMAFVSSADLTGDNPVGYPQLFLECGGNRPPVADAGPDQIVQGDLTGHATVTLDGRGSSDADADPLAYGWSGAFGSASGAQPQVTLPPGTHTIALTVDDGRNTATDWVRVTVNGCTAPQVTARAKSGQVQLAWAAVPGALGYNVYRSTVAGGPYTLLGNRPSTVLAYLDRPLINGTTYHYIVRTTGALGVETCQSSQASATPTGR